MIRIASRRVDSRTMISVAGKIDEEHLGVLDQHCVAAETPIIFDLTDTKSVDKAAIRWLIKRLARGDEIVGASPYINFLLEREQRSPDSLSTSATRGCSEEGE